VGRITIGNILQGEASNKTNDIWIGWLEDSVDLAVLVFKLLDKRLDDDLCGIEHDRLQSADLFRFDYVVTSLSVPRCLAGNPAKHPRAMKVKQSSGKG